MNILKRSCSPTPEAIQVSKSRRIASVTKPEAQRLLLLEESETHTYREVEDEGKLVGEKKLTEVSPFLHKILFTIWWTDQGIAIPV